jgi:hypothetical protein
MLIIGYITDLSFRGTIGMARSLCTLFGLLLTKAQPFGLRLNNERFLVTRSS